MISKNTARLINFMPKPMLRTVAKFLIKKYIGKYANITIINKGKLDSIKGPVIFISNHLSNADGLILNHILKDKEVTFVAGIKLAKNSLTSLGLEILKTVPINPNSPDKSAISTTIKLLKSGNSICIFPEGTRSRVGSMIKGRKGIILISKLSKVPMVPIGIEGTEKLLPINESDMGSEKFNYADVKVTIGDCFYLPEKQNEEDKEDYQNNTVYFIMKKIAILLASKYQGIYKKII